MADANALIVQIHLFTNLLKFSSVFFRILKLRQPVEQVAELSN